MIAHGKDIKVITGNSNPGLAKDICKELGIPLGNSETEHNPPLAIVKGGIFYGTQ